MGGLIVKEVMFIFLLLSSLSEDTTTSDVVDSYLEDFPDSSGVAPTNVSKAYLQGQHDPKYEEIVRAISAITFLATPHRGTDFARTLNRILQSTLLSTPKQYITDLTKNSFTLQKLNEQFRHIAPRLDIISFYETQPTSIGHKKARIVSSLGSN